MRFNLIIAALILLLVYFIASRGCDTDIDCGCTTDCLDAAP